MADHYEASIALIAEHEQISDQITHLYLNPTESPTTDTSEPGVRVVRPDVELQRQLNALAARQRVVLTLAKIHATLSVRQALQDRTAAL